MGARERSSVSRRAENSLASARTGGRTYNPFAKRTETFELDPCRSDAPAAEASLTSSEPIIRLKQGGGAQLLR